MMAREAYLQRWHWSRGKEWDLEGKNLAGRGNSRCKSSEIGKRLGSTRNSREAGVNREKSDGRCIREGSGAKWERFCFFFFSLAIKKSLDFILLWFVGAYRITCENNRKNKIIRFKNCATPREKLAIKCRPFILPVNAGHTLCYQHQATNFTLSFLMAIAK